MLSNLLGIFGVIFISIGILKKKRKTQDIYFIIGGIFLEIYSIILKNPIFIILQIIFISSAIYDYNINKRIRNKK
jgi:hypothetical protein